jgi:hypothetical protein
MEIPRKWNEIREKMNEIREKMNEIHWSGPGVLGGYD